MNDKPQENKKRRRIWVQHVAVDADKLQMRLNAARAGSLSPHQDAIAVGVSGLIEKARAAAFRRDPIPRRWANWWRGTLVEAGYRNMHTARAQMVDLLDEDEVRAEIPMALARAQSTLRRDDPRLMDAEQMQADASRPGSVNRLRPRLRRLIGDSYEQLDLDHAQLRSFRNILLLAALSVFILVVAVVVIVSRYPTWIPLCFPKEVVAATNVTTQGGLNCPTGSGVSSPRHADIGIVAILGALGGALAATLSIRNLKGTTTPYDVPVALAMLKFPLGAFTAILALVAIQGNFVPGLSVLDSQGQILAYALVFGFAQQAFTRLLDQKAQTLLEGLPGGTATEPPRRPAAAPEVPSEPVPPSAPAAPVETGSPEEVVPEEVVPAEVVPAESGTPGEEADLTEDIDPMQAEEGEPDLSLLPDQNDAAYTDDGLGEREAGPDAQPGVKYPTPEEET